MYKGHNRFRRGLADGLPIMFGYLSVSFAFGIYCVSGGLNIWQTTLISAVNLTSAGQLAGVGIILSGGTLVEMAVSQLVINMRYALMSISLSQRLDESIKLSDRFVFSFFVTDEIFAVSVGRAGSVGRAYMAGLVVTPFLGWTAGTFLGALMGNILPDFVISALGIAIYGMFIAIIIPPAKKHKPVAGVVALSVALSCAFRYIPLLSDISTGFSVIICAVVSAGLLTFVAPIEADESEAEV